MTNTPLIQFYGTRVPLHEALDSLAEAMVTDHPSGLNAPQLLRRWATELRNPTTESDST